MIRSRRSRAIAALIALVCLLFTQLAVAAYACPNLLAGRSGAHTSSRAPGMEDMPGCSEPMDMEQPNLCHAHAQVGNQSLDKPTVPPVQPFMPLALAQAIVFVEAEYAPPAASGQSSSLTRITSPPASIRHCCFRI
ncbi:hypothetical protein [Massilia cavernae]|uniref:Uncharacterized protein n=1 Tax=Massilia cavernae TaxID=2320864 RepID=A0A418Y768_9BURK|nr:hypothetical protein [Massilia cavernae]RJG24683.1 hypothetical protein D3872_03395 [Massilia cavernae]